MSRARVTAVRRSSLPLTERDQQDLALLRASEPQREALGRLTGEPVIGADVSEVALIHAVFAAGLRALREATEEAGYAELAAQQTGELAVRRAESRRRRPVWAEDQ